MRQALASGQLSHTLPIRTPEVLREDHPNEVSGHDETSADAIHLTSQLEERAELHGVSLDVIEV